MKRVAFAIIAFLAGGCHKAQEGPRDPSVLVANAPETDSVVATVDGRPIRASDVVAQARTDGTDAKHALSTLIDAEVLAGLALQRGLYDDEDVVYARRAAESRRLLATDFEPRTTADKVPEADLRAAYEKNISYYDRPELAEVNHIVALASNKGPAADRAKAKAQIIALLPRAQAAKTEEEFAKLAAQPGDVPEKPGDVPEKSEHMTFPPTGVVVEPFAEAAFALRPGQTSGPVETSFGWHIIRLLGKTPGHHVSFDQAEAELREKIWPSWRQQQLALFIQQLSERWPVVMHPERLDQAEVQ